MYEELKQSAEMVEEREKVLVPVRRREADKQAEQEIEEDSREGKQRETPRRWFIY